MRVYQVTYEICEPHNSHKRDLFCVADSIEQVWNAYKEYPQQNEFMRARLIYIGEFVPLDVWLPREHDASVIEEDA